MHAKMELPKAFSIRDEHEFSPIQHLMARLNPKLLVEQVATGVHVNGGETVFWGLVYLPGEPPSNLKVQEALREAGFDFARNVLIRPAFARTDHSAWQTMRKSRKTMAREPGTKQWIEDCRTGSCNGLTMSEKPRPRLMGRERQPIPRNRVAVLYTPSSLKL